MNSDAVVASAVLSKMDRHEVENDADTLTSDYWGTTYFSGQALYRRYPEAVSDNTVAFDLFSNPVVEIGEPGALPVVSVIGYGALGKGAVLRLSSIGEDLLSWDSQAVHQVAQARIERETFDDRNAFVVVRKTHAHIYALLTGLKADQTQAVPDVLKANWLELSQSHLSNLTFARLSKIAEKRDGWQGPGSLGLSAASLSEFLKFWREIRSANSIEPELMLTPKGTLQAEWHRSRRQYFEIEFSKERGIGNFGLMDRLSGFDGIMPIMEIVKLIKGYRDGIAFTWTNG